MPIIEISPLELVLAMAAPDAPILLDLRIAEDREEDPGTLPGAYSCAHTDCEGQLALLRGRSAVTICQKGLKISAGATARLTAHGVRVWRLTGGDLGWRKAGLPLVQTPPPTRLVIPEDPDLAEAFNIWALYRFVAPLAELIEVPRADVPGVAAQFDATIHTDLIPADVPGLRALSQSLSGPLADLLKGRAASYFATFDLAFRASMRHQSTMEPQQ